MPFEYRQGPIYFHAVESDLFRQNYDDIFRKPKKEVTETIPDNTDAPSVSEQPPQDTPQE